MKFYSVILLAGLAGVSLNSLANEATSSSSVTGYLQIQLENLTPYTAAYREASVPYFVHLKSHFPTLGTTSPSNEGSVNAEIDCDNSNNDDLLIFYYDLKDSTGKIVGSCNSTIALNCTVSSKSSSVTVAPSGVCSGPFMDSVMMPGSSTVSSGGMASPSFAFFPSTTNKK